MMKLTISGAGGRIGRLLIEALVLEKKAQLIGALARTSSLYLGQDPGTWFCNTELTGILVTDRAEIGLYQADCLIDFTRPEATLDYLNAAEKLGVNMVIGTTGFTESQKEKIKKASEKIAIVYAPNMSIEVNILFKLIEKAAHYLHTGYDIEILEMHHRHKVDAPSGTALEMGRIIQRTIAKLTQKTHSFTTHTEKNASPKSRSDQHIGFSAVRGGTIIGEHTAYFIGPDERIEITHRSSSRASYVKGALKAAAFLQGKSSGLYTMQQVLDLE